jgi:hypothetical protein
MSALESWRNIQLLVSLATMPSYHCTELVLLRRLPFELYHEVFGYLPPHTRINLAFAAYRDFSSYKLVPDMTPSRLDYLMGKTTSSNMFRNWPLPPEVTLGILERLNFRELIEFVITHYWILHPTRLMPELTPETIQELHQASMIASESPASP